jgi:hypothetical protein
MNFTLSNGTNIVYIIITTAYTADCSKKKVKIKVSLSMPDRYTRTVAV